MQEVTTKAELRAAVRTARAHGRQIRFVATMGALHAGHLALVRAAAEHPGGGLRAQPQPEGAQPPGFTVVSIFVNPTQFAPGEDYEAYPRDHERDADRLRELGAPCPDLLYAPPVTEMYPGWDPHTGSGLATAVTVSGLTDRLCGASRPGHFDGVATVVAKLFNQVQPDVAFFGRKDYQQLVVIRRMVADLDLPVEIVGVPTVRDPDGVATSSRNDYLSGEERLAARSLSQALADAVRAARRARTGQRPVTAGLLREAALARLRGEPGVDVDYVEVADPATLAPPDRDGRGGEDDRLLVAVAAHVGAARLIDNVVVGDEADEQRLVEAIGGRPLDERSPA